MRKEVIVRGRFSSPRLVELDEPITDFPGQVEVVLRPLPEAEAGDSVLDLLSSLAPGTRSKDDIDRQLADERSAW